GYCKNAGPPRAHGRGGRVQRLRQTAADPPSERPVGAAGRRDGTRRIHRGNSRPRNLRGDWPTSRSRTRGRHLHPTGVLAARPDLADRWNGFPLPSDRRRASGQRRDSRVRLLCAIRPAVEHCAVSRATHRGRAVGARWRPICSPL
ncbi:MAG: hypothetical protein AVDCRST_MAG77-5516, partial [uncultured Chloroflexi bacterium]